MYPVSHSGPPAKPPYDVYQYGPVDNTLACKFLGPFDMLEPPSHLSLSVIHVNIVTMMFTFEIGEFWGMRDYSLVEVIASTLNVVVSKQEGVTAVFCGQLYLISGYCNIL